MKALNPLFFFALAAVVVFGLTAPALAGSIGVADDTWVRSDSPDSNRDSNDYMNVRTDIDSDDNDLVLLRFPTADLPAGASDVVLTLYWHRNDGSTGKTLSLYGLNESDPDETTWTESTVTYNNAPGIIQDNLDPTAETTAGNTTKREN